MAVAKRAGTDKREWRGKSLNCPSQKRNLQPKGEAKVQLHGVSWGLYLEGTIRLFNLFPVYFRPLYFIQTLLKTLNYSYFRPKEAKLCTQTKMERLRMHFYCLYSSSSFTPLYFLLIPIQLFVWPWNKWGGAMIHIKNKPALCYNSKEIFNVMSENSRK